MTAAFQTDSTRVVTFQMAIEQSNRVYWEIGISDSYNGLDTPRRGSGEDREGHPH